MVLVRNQVLCLSLPHLCKFILRVEHHSRISVCLMFVVLDAGLGLCVKNTQLHLPADNQVISLLASKRKGWIIGLWIFSSDIQFHDVTANHTL